MEVYKEVPSVELTQISAFVSFENESAVSSSENPARKTRIVLSKEPFIKCIGRNTVVYLLFIVAAAVVIFLVATRRPTLPSRTVECYNYPNKSLSFIDWLHQNDTRSIDLCDPKFVPPNSRMDVTKPIKVFILLGQSNMVGMGWAYGSKNKTLEHVIRQEGRYQHLNIWDVGGGEPPIYYRPDVRYVAVDQDFDVSTNDWLQLPEHVGTNPRFGIELQFGYIMGELLKEPVLVLKSCIGNRALGWDLLPPGTGRYNDSQGYTYAAYGETHETWLANTSKPPPSEHWYAGKEYDVDVANAKRVLQNLTMFFPGLDNTNRKTRQPNYEITGFLWWQGMRDSVLEGHAYHYEENLVRLIDSLRRDFEAPRAKFVLASIGFGGYKMEEFSHMLDTQEYPAPYFANVFEAQMAMNDYQKYPRFQGNVKAVDIRSSWRPQKKLFLDYWHYYYNANTYMEVGNSLGLAMATLLFG